ncbi:MAG: hypothetical protein LBE79_05500 [Tannerella sp.]|jgi:hypothetical protein|nr:hypothetical protein [Tannerella sp.]
MRKLKIFAILNVVMMSFFGCINYPIYDFDYHGKIVSLTTGWKERGNDIDIPESYTVKIGDYTDILSGTNNSIDHLFPSGKYIINVWNTANHITISDRLATADYTAGELGWFFTGKQEVTIEIDGEHSFTVFMQQHVRQLTFELEIADEVKYRLAGINATLSGVAGTLNMDDGTHSAPVIMALTFAEAPEDNKWKATVRLLGVTGNSQTLSLMMNFADDHSISYAFTWDLSSQFAFNEDKKTPLTLIARFDGTQIGME